MPADSYYVGKKINAYYVNDDYINYCCEAYKGECKRAKLKGKKRRKLTKEDQAPRIKYQLLDAALEAAEGKFETISILDIYSGDDVRNIKYIYKAMVKNTYDDFGISSMEIINIKKYQIYFPDSSVCKCMKRHLYEEICCSMLDAPLIDEG